jgi:ribosomal protein L14
LLLKESWLNVTDNTNVRWIKIFHLYKGFYRKSTKNGFFVKGSARIVEPPRIEYKGFKYKYNVKGDICRLLITRVVLKKLVKDGLVSSFAYNSGISIKKKFEPKSKYLNGPINRSINRRKVITLFPYVI